MQNLKEEDFREIVEDLRPNDYLKIKDKCENGSFARIIIWMSLSYNYNNY